MAAVWELSRPEHGGRYDITVYQEGWRLGGKGASGRGKSGRIEEHGLHIWLGFYDNAFRMMRECLAELAASPEGSPFGDLRDGWTPSPDVGLFSATETGGWQRWTAHFPPRPGLPGDPFSREDILSLPLYLSRAFDLLRTVLTDTTVFRHDLAPEEPAGAVATLLHLGVFAGAATLAEALGLVGTMLRSTPEALAGPWLETALRLCAECRRWIEDRLLADDRYRFIWEVSDLTLATIVGILRHNLLTDPRGLDAIEDYECRDWLMANGASARSVQSPYIRGLYDLSMGYVNGDENQPSLSAGQGIRGCLRTFFGYRGALMWTMRAGMGDVVFAPLYEALRRRGVKFEFFHRLTNVGLPPGGVIGPGDRSHVASLTFDVQATIAGGGEYQPLVDFHGRPCWLSEPDFDQLEDGERMAAEAWNLESHWDRRRAGEPARSRSAAISISSSSASASARFPTSARRSSRGMSAGGT